jgi:hypothetical protein
LKRELNHIRWGEIEKHTRGINETKIDHPMPFLNTELQTKMRSWLPWKIL